MQQGARTNDDIRRALFEQATIDYYEPVCRRLNRYGLGEKREVRTARTARGRGLPARRAAQRATLRRSPTHPADTARH